MVKFFKFTVKPYNSTLMGGELINFGDFIQAQEDALNKLLMIGYCYAFSFQLDDHRGKHIVIVLFKNPAKVDRD